jgi:hypothetical protein
MALLGAHTILHISRIRVNVIVLNSVIVNITLRHVVLLPVMEHATIKKIHIHTYRVFNLKVGRQLSREYFTTDVIYNGFAGRYEVSCQQFCVKI